jgi:hypothetical protein
MGRCVGGSKRVGLEVTEGESFAWKGRCDDPVLRKIE